MRILVTGGAGFVGSHLCEALLARGDSVVCVDNLSTGRMANIEHLTGQAGFQFLPGDVTGGIALSGRLDAVAHLASPASPRAYLRLPLQTLAAGSHGTATAIELAHKHQARFILASSSEVYGDPAVHPQTEDYWGHVNPIGLRSVYDEAKRYAEALTAAWCREHGFNGGIARIFNTYGPRMSGADGRVITNFITQAMTGQPLTIYGSGQQTRSFCYIEDLVRALVALVDSAEPGPLNLGNCEELTIADLAVLVLRITGSDSPIARLPVLADDPTRRCPDIALAAAKLGWQPRVRIAEGLRRTVDWFRSSPHELAVA